MLSREPLQSSALLGSFTNLTYPYPTCCPSPHAVVALFSQPSGCSSMPETLSSVVRVHTSARSSCFGVYQQPTSCVADVPAGCTFFTSWYETICGMPATQRNGGD